MILHFWRADQTVDNDSLGIGDPLVCGDNVETSPGSDLDNCSDGGDDDAWPPDIDGDTVVTMLDVDPLNAAFGVSLGDCLYGPRLDLQFDGTIDVVDVMVLQDLRLRKDMRWTADPERERPCPGTY